MRESLLTQFSKARILRKCIGRPFLRANEWLWYRLPSSVRTTRITSRYGAFLHSLVKLRSHRQQFHGTYFFRNRPELRMILAVANHKPEGSNLRLAVLGCSNGAEVYSILWTIRRSRPDLRVMTRAIDISNDVLEIGRNGIYEAEHDHLVNSPIFDKITEKEMQLIFDQENDKFRIKSWLKEGIQWQVADARDPSLPQVLGAQDIVVANKFLCHMIASDAEQCLRNLARLVKPGGYLVCSGVDLEIRTKVAIELDWTPLGDLIEELHNGDTSVTRDWPWRYWGLEPFNKTRPDWSIRYASVFQLGAATSSSHVPDPRPKLRKCAYIL
jgi:chemotaxis methyl-accepting protein methylase